MMSDPDRTARFYDELWPHRAALLRTALFLARDPSAAEDLAQKAMLKAFAALDRLRPGSNPKAWLMAILRNVHIDRLRSRHGNEVPLDEVAADLPANSESAPSAPPDEAELSQPALLMEALSDQQVITALKSLPPDICWTLLLVDVHGLPDTEAAEVLEVPPGTVKSRLHRGRRMLAGRLLPLARERRLVPPKDHS